MTGFASGMVEGITSHLSHLSPGEALIFDMALILIISAILAFIAKTLRQPLIPAYVFTGLIIGPLFLGLIGNESLIEAFSEIGIAFLLFTAGLEISFKKIKEANLKKILFIGTFQIVLIVLLSMAFSNMFGLSTMQAAYMGIILAFGSTMVDIKLLAEKGELVTLHGRLVLGILLLQDLAAIIAIVFFTTGGFAFAPLAIAFGKLLLILFVAFLLQRYILNGIFRSAAESSELLFLSSLAVLFVFILMSYLAELSIVIGAFIAGVSLANSPFKTELESRVSPLRDFFAILFFVALGMQIVFTGVGEKVPLLIGLLVAALIIKPLITFILLRISGFKEKTSFQTSICLAQMSEFSLIIGALGLKMGAFGDPILSTIILATIITMSLTPYFVKYKDGMFKLIKYPLRTFKFLPVKEHLEYSSSEPKEILLVGAHRMGAVLLKELKSKRDKLVVIDYNPEIINALIENKISCIYGDVTSPELLTKLDAKKLKMVISTVPDYDDNLHLLRKLRKVNPKIKMIATGSRISETLSLYEHGADYVMTPKVIAGEELAQIVRREHPNLKKAKKEHIGRLNDIHKILY